MGAHEPRLLAVETQVLAPINLLLLAGPELLYDLVFLGNDLCQVDADLASPNAPPGGVARVVSYLRTMDHSFRRCAACINAGAAEIALLDQSYSPPEVSQATRKRITGLPRANDDRIVFHVLYPLLCTREQAREPNNGGLSVYQANFSFRRLEAVSR
jgi:hypothetical protein